MIFVDDDINEEKEQTKRPKTPPLDDGWNAVNHCSNLGDANASYKGYDLIAFEQAREHDKPNRDREQRGEGGGIDDGGGGGEGVAQASLPQRDIVR